MKNIFYALLLFSVMAHGQIVNIPDVNFKAILLAADTSNTTARDLNDVPSKIDINSDGEIQNSEAEAISYLEVFAPIDDVTGIEAFTNIRIIYFVGLNINSFSTAGLSNLNFLTLANGHLTNLDVSGAPNIENLDLTQNQINDYSFISALPNLKSISVRNNSNIESLDFSNNPVLNGLDTTNCSNLQTINFGSLSTSLENLVIGSCMINSIDISPFVNLKVLDCSYNSLTDLNLSNANHLTDLYCSGNFFTSLDFSNLVNLKRLGCSYTNINATNLSDVSGVDYLECAGTLPVIDLTNFQNLETLFCGGNNLTNLLLKNGRNETVYLYLSSPNLTFICADESQVSNLQSTTSTNAPNAVISSYCSFTPGGIYNTVSGVAQWDENNDGCDASDSNFPYNIKMKLSNGTIENGTFLNATGNYTLYAETGTYTLVPQVEHSEYFNINPTSSTINFLLLNSSISEQNFCITPNGIHPDLEVVLSPTNSARPGFDAHYKIIYKNKGNVSLSGQINLNFDDAHTDFVSANPVIDSQSGNDLYWAFSNLVPFETRVIDVVLNLNSPTENPPLNSGSVLHFVAQTNFSVGESTPYDNTFELNQNVINSHDPNDKTCLEGNTIAASEIGKYVHYNINFENIGTSEAVNIVVKDTINLQMFDINSLQLLYASHPVETKIRDSIVEFIFRGIHLPPSNGGPIGGHGNVLFKIKTLPTLQVGDEIANTANIFFDYNHPIETNEARSAYANLSKSVFTKDESIDLLPNPTRDKATVSALNALKSIEIYDVQGRLLQTIIEHSKTKTIDLSSYSRGIYWIKINTEKGSAVQKLIKE